MIDIFLGLGFSFTFKMVNEYLLCIFKFSKNTLNFLFNCFPFPVITSNYSVTVIYLLKKKKKLQFVKLLKSIANKKKKINK